MTRRRAESEGGEAQPTPPKMVCVLITHYKVKTSQGRGIKGQHMDLPEAEALELQETGWAKLS